MPLVPVVAIEIPAEVAPDLAAVLLRSCNLALGTGRCAAADSDTGSNQELAWIANFNMDPAEPSQLRVDLRNATPQGTHTRLTRTLAFEGNEGSSHRWSTAGVVVAALVVSAESTSHDSPPPEDPSANPATPSAFVTTTRKPKKSPPPPSTLPAAEPSRAVRIDLGALLGTGVEEAALRFGGRLRPSVEFSRLAFVWSDFSVARANQAVETWFLSGAVGLGFVTRSTGNSLAVEGRFGLRGDRLQFQASEGPLTAQDNRLRVGATAGVDFSLTVSRALALWLGGETGLLFPRVNVNVGSNRVGQLGLMDGQLNVGLRYRLDFDSR